MAFAVLIQIDEKGAYADRVLDGRFRSDPSLDPRDRALTTELVYGVLRRRGTLDRVLQAHLKKPLQSLDPEVARILRLGAYQILLLDRVPDHAAVSESVDLARRQARPGSQGLVNAVLRSLCREKEKAGSGALATDAKQDYPEWLVRLWERELGVRGAEQVFASLLSPPSTVVRVNPLRSSPEELTERLAAQGFAAEPLPQLPGALVLAGGGGDPRKTEPFRLGWCVQQDAASQLVVPALDPQPGERILDLCAAPGIKTTQAAGSMGNRGLIVAADIRPARLREVARLCSRLGITMVRPICADGAKPGQTPFPERSFDRVLVDAPCSGLGVLRRNPERKWRAPPDFDSLRRLQGGLLETVARLVRTGGLLVYSTCTLNRSENEGLIEGFLAAHPDFVREDIALFLPAGLRRLCSEAGDLCSWQAPDFGDLFFASRLRRLPRSG